MENNNFFDQDIQPKMSADTAAAALSYATHLSEKVFGMKSNPEISNVGLENPPQEQENAQGATEKPELMEDTTTENKEPKNEELKKSELDDLRKELKTEVKNLVKEGMDSIRKMIKDAIE